MGKTITKTNKQQPNQNSKQEFMHTHKCTQKKTQQTTPKQTADSKNTTTYNVANKQEKQKTQTSLQKINMK